MNADRLTELGITKLTVGQKYRIVDLNTKKKYWTVLTCVKIGRYKVLIDENGEYGPRNKFWQYKFEYTQKYWKEGKGDYLELYGRRVK